VYKLGKNWQTRAWHPVFKTAGSASNAAQKILRLPLIVSYIELFIFILIFFVPHQNDVATTLVILIISFEQSYPSDKSQNIHKKFGLLNY
jgi:hypothetical protein